jgi:ubiquinone/menaquinone biosynthesis C-methylase UbiE
VEEADRRWIDSMPEAYEGGLVATVFRPFAKDLAQRAARLGPQRVLELAAGTGVLTLEVLGMLPSADVVATDLNEPMVALGELHAPRALWRTADAMDLPFEDAAFDLVLCQFGVMFFPDKPAALSEVRRVLVAGGSCLLNVWGALAAHDFQAAVVAACDRLFPHSPPSFMRSVPHYYANVDTLVADIEAAGLRVVEVEQLVLESPQASAVDIAVGYCFGTPLRSEIEARGGDFDSVVGAIASEIEGHLGGGTVTGRMQAYVVRSSTRLSTDGFVSPVTVDVETD